MRKHESIETSISFQKVGDDLLMNGKNILKLGRLKDFNIVQLSKSEGHGSVPIRVLCVLVLIQVYKVILESNEKIADDVQVAGCPST